MKKLFTKLTSKKSHKHDKNSSHSTSTTETKQSADDDGKTIERDLKWKLERITLNTVPKNVSCAAYDPMQKIIAVGTRDGFVHIFGRYGVEFTIYPPADVQDRIKSLQFSVNTGYLLGVCANNDKTHLSIWSMKHRCLKHKIEIKKAKITSLLVPVGQNHAYFASMLDTQATVHAVNISYGTISKFKLQRDNASVTCLEAHPHHDQFIVAGMSNGNCCVFNVLKQEQNLITYSHPVISDPVTSISWSPTSDCFVVGYVSGEVIIWEIQKNLLQQLNSPTPIQQPLSTNIQTPLTVLRNRGPRPVSVHWIGEHIFIAIKDIAPVTPAQPIDAPKPLPQPPQKPQQVVSPVKESITEVVSPVKEQEQAVAQVETTTVVSPVPNTTPIVQQNVVDQQTSAPPNEVKPLTLVQNSPPPVKQPAPSPRPAPVRDPSGIYRYPASKNTPQKPHPIFEGSVDLFMPLIKSVPYKTLPQYQIRYAGVIINGEFRIIDITANNTTIKIGNFTSQDDSCDAIVDMCLVENMNFMERLFAKQHVSGNNTWPIDGGEFNLSSPHKKKTVSHLLVTQYQDGSAMLWSAGGTDTGNVTRICSVHQKQEGGKSLSHIVSWSRENIIAAFDDGSLSFVDVVTLQSGQLSTTTPRAIVKICPVQHLQQLVVAYSDSTIEVVDMMIGEQMTIISTINLNENNQDVITCLEVFTLDKMEGLFLAVGFRSSRFVCVSLKDSKIVNQIHPPKQNPLFAIYSLDSSECYPCMLPDSDSMPHFIAKQKYESMSDKKAQSKWSMKFNAKNPTCNVPVYVSSQDNPSTELAVEIFINNGITLSDGMFEIVLNDTSSNDTAMYIQLGPASIKVGHGGQVYDVNIELEDMQQLGACSRIIITHNPNIRKYRVYTFKQKNSNKHEVLSILNYDEGDDEIEQLIQGDVTISPTTPINPYRVINNVGVNLYTDTIPQRLNPIDYHNEPLTFDTPEAYLRNIVPKINIWTRHHFTSINDLLKIPADVNVAWSCEYVAPAKYLVQCRENEIQTNLLKFKQGHLDVDKIKIVKSPIAYIAAKPSYVGDDCVLITLDASHVIRGYSLPKLECLTKHSLTQPHLLRSLSIPHSCFTVSSTGTVFVSTGDDTLLQAQLMEQYEDPMVIVDPTLFVPGYTLPQKPQPPIIGSVATGLFTRFLSNVAKKLEDPLPVKPFDHDQLDCVNISKEVEAKLYDKQPMNDQYVITTLPVRDDTIDTSVERILGTKKKPLPPIVQPSQTRTQPLSKKDELFGEPTSYVWDSPQKTTGNAKIGALNDNMNETKSKMSENLSKVKERGDKIKELQNKTALLSDHAGDFAKKTAMLKQKNTFFGF